MRWLSYVGMPASTHDASAMFWIQICFFQKQIQKIWVCLSVNSIHQQLAI